MKKLSISISDFKEIIENGHYFLDKSLFIKEIINSDAKVLLLPRPRRFGKTLNLSMLKYFFEKSQETNKQLFKDLGIEKEKKIMNLQGQYPVIFLTFKDIKELNWDNTISKIKDLIAQEFSKHDYLVNSNTLKNFEKEYFNNIISKKAEQSDYENSLKNLSIWLAKFYNKKTIILIDEYDSPITAGYLKNYYDQIIGFMRNFLSAGLKDNSYLEKAVITGVLRVAKESIFSGLNNLKVYSILNENFSEYFGFLQNEVEEILNYYGLESKIAEVKEWYDGYNFAQNKIYNPWSIINFIADKGEFGIFWVNTSDNELIKNLITNGDENLKKDIESIVANKINKHIINDTIIFKDIEKISESTLNLLLFSGYLTVSGVKYNKNQDAFLGKLSIPNREIRSLYKNIIRYWFNASIGKDNYKLMLKNLINGNIKEFQDYFSNFVLSSFSTFDLPENESEKVYHSFVLGMLISLNKDYILKSNRESGFGRYDVILIPKNKNKLGIILEFKKAKEKESLTESSQDALKQIQDKKYDQELKDLGIKNLLLLGIAFKGKMVEISSMGKI
ncbi:ATP-binding protein [Candidatus Babeliales bacterium]|nr:ATP-binding protein [Candidatus Babeliales bacterium]MCF7899636.1 ATP-binding protein [Candidatus Babeliales bacterium]